MSVQRWSRLERVASALSRASVEASRYLLIGDADGLRRWEAAESEALAELDRARRGAILQLDAFADASPLFPGPRA